MARMAHAERGERGRRRHPARVAHLSARSIEAESLAGMFADSRGRPKFWIDDVFLLLCDKVL
jgi:hypothetical protein